MAIDITVLNVHCTKCGTEYPKRKGNFAQSYGYLYRGTGTLGICKKCLEQIYQTYFAQCGDQKAAVRQTCRKLDIYWNELLYESALQKSTLGSIIYRYLSKTNNKTCLGKTYDDTLLEEGTLWYFKDGNNQSPDEIVAFNNSPEARDDGKILTTKNNIEITDEVVQFWGGGYTKAMYRELEQRRLYWMDRLPKGIEIDIGTEAIIRQICSLELDINRDRLAGKAVDKSVNALNTLLGSANMKPTQKKEDVDSATENTPLGVWIWKYENERPLPEVDPELQDVDGIKKYTLTWFYGHLCKMLNIKNSYSKLYEEEINKMRIERPEYEDEDDEQMLYDIFGGDDSDKNNNATRED